MKESSTSEPVYHLKRGGKIFGPYTLTQIEAAEQSGKLRAGDMLSPTAKGPWQECSEWLVSAPTTIKVVADQTNVKPVKDTKPTKQTSNATNQTFFLRSGGKTEGPLKLTEIEKRIKADTISLNDKIGLLKDGPWEDFEISDVYINYRLNESREKEFAPSVKGTRKGLRGFADGVTRRLLSSPWIFFVAVALHLSTVFFLLLPTWFWLASLARLACELLITVACFKFRNQMAGDKGFVWAIGFFGFAAVAAFCASLFYAFEENPYGKSLLPKIAEWDVPIMQLTGILITISWWISRQIEKQGIEMVGMQIVLIPVFAIIAITLVGFGSAIIAAGPVAILLLLILLEIVNQKK